ncbi:MAG: hypothetical protein VB050_08110 [Geobacteraceae bacterium]|nr:hypothetical protein [Geobacteraceae bacterium]
MDIEKVDKIIQFALAVAAHDDDFRSRELGPIHLIKYVYIADLAYAERKGGQTYTGVDWTFYKFGPWAEEVYNRIDTACQKIGAKKRTFPFGEEGEGVRWKVVDLGTYETLENDLSVIVSIAVKRAVREFGSDTAGLLNCVYLSKPMLNAAPGERLDFSKAVLPPQQIEEQEKEPVSKKGQKKRTVELKEARSRIQQKLLQKRTEACLTHYIRQPRYDDVFFAGQKWLDSLDGHEVPELKGEVSFSPDIWKSKARFDPEIS